MNNNNIKQSHLQAFFAKKDIFLQKLVLDCLFSENFLTLIYRKEESTTMTLCFKKSNYYDSRVKKQSNLQAFFAKKDREDTK